MTQDTSNISYNQIKKELGKRQKDVLRAISILKEASNYEIANFLGIPINAITPRTNELVKAGYVRASGTKLNQIKRPVITWALSSWHSPYDNYIPNAKEQGTEQKRIQEI